MNIISWQQKEDPMYCHVAGIVEHVQILLRRLCRWLENGVFLTCALSVCFVEKPVYHGHIPAMLHGSQPSHNTSTFSRQATTTTGLLVTEHQLVDANFIVHNLNLLCSMERRDLSASCK